MSICLRNKFPLKFKHTPPYFWFFGQSALIKYYNLLFQLLSLNIFLKYRLCQTFERCYKLLIRRQGSNHRIVIQEIRCIFHFSRYSFSHLPRKSWYQSRFLFPKPRNKNNSFWLLRLKTISIRSVSHFY